MTISPPVVWKTPLQTLDPISQFITLSNGHLYNGTNRYVAFGFNLHWWCIAGSCLAYSGGKYQPYSAGRALLCKNLDNIVHMGANAIRLHGIDGLLGNNIFCCGPGPQISTRNLDPISMEVLCYFLEQCKIRGLRVMITLHYTRQLVAGDLPTWPCPSFEEVVNTNTGTGFGCMHPWMWFDTGLQQLQVEFITNLLSYTNIYTGLQIGKDPVLLGVILQNEHSIVRDGPFYNESIYQQLVTTNEETYCKINNIIWKGQFTLNKVQMQQWLISVEKAFYTLLTQTVKAISSTLVDCGTYYGEQSFATLVAPYSVGEILDFHNYSRFVPSDTNGFIYGLNTNSLRTRFSALGAGCTWADQNGQQKTAVACTEYAGVGQYNPLTRDPANECAQMMGCVVDAAVHQDIDLLFLYTYSQSPFNVDPYQKFGVYDFCNDPITLNGIRSNIAKFMDLDLRPTTQVNIPLLPADIYGSGTGNAYTQSSPYFSNNLYSISQLNKVMMVPFSGI